MSRNEIISVGRKSSSIKPLVAVTQVIVTKSSAKVEVTKEMDHLFNAFISRRASAPSAFCDRDIPVQVYKKKKRASLGSLISSRFSPPIPSSDHAKGNSELLNVMDEQLLQIREKIAAFRQQDTQFRERMDSLNESVSELVSRSSINSSLSECSDLDSLDEASEAEDEKSEK